MHFVTPSYKECHHRSIRLKERWNSVNLNSQCTPFYKTINAWELVPEIPVERWQIDDDGSLVHDGQKMLWLTSLHVWRKTHCAGKYDGYFDFKRL